MLNKVFVLFVVLFFLIVPQVQSKDVDAQGVLAIAKIAGSCGILDELIDFQSKTKLEGGESFVTRFWSTEAARRGLSVREMSNQCDSAILTYDQLWKSSEK